MLHGHGDHKYQTGRRINTSADRNWSTLLAERWTHGQGALPDTKPAETEIAIMLAGKLRVKRRGDGQLQDTLAVPGTIWICPAGILEQEIYLSGDIEDCIHLYIPSTPLSSLALRELDIDPAQVSLRYEGGFHDPLIEQIGRSILAEMEDESTAGTLLVETLRAALAAHLFKNYSTLSSKRVALPTAQNALDKKRLRRVLDFIAANLDQNLTLEQIAGEACLSPFHFARAFKAAMGKAPHCYITEQKLEQAKRLIIDNRYPLTEIASMTGFSNQAHFTRMFKREFGLTPGEFRSRIGK